MRLLNFKGHKSFEINLNPLITNVCGDNGTGKTTLADSYCWCFTGKGQNGKELDIKPYDQHNKIIEKIEHDVELFLDVETDGNIRSVILKRGLRDVWTNKKQKGEVFTGNETIYYFNDAKLNTAAEYSDKLRNFIDIRKFCLLSFPFYFSSLDWKERREILLELSGEISDADIIGSDISLLSVYAALEENMLTMEQYKASTTAKKNDAIKELAEQKPRREEVQRLTPVEPDYVMVNSKVKILEEELSELEEKLSDASNISQAALEEKQAKQLEIYELRNKLTKIQNDVRANLQNLTFQKSTASQNVKNDIIQRGRDFDALAIRIKNNNSKIVELEKKREALRVKYDAENNKTITFDESKSYCPTCKRAYDARDVAQKREELTANFNSDKVKNIEEIKRDGKTVTVAIDAVKLEIYADTTKSDNLSKEIEELKKKLPKADENPLPTLDELLIANAEYQTLKSTIDEKEKLKDVDSPPPDTTELKAKKVELQGLLGIEKAKLNLKTTIDTNNLRNQEISEKERLLSIQITEYQKIEESILLYTKLKCEIISERVNKLFSSVQFRMFEDLINGNEKPCCDILVGGVPFDGGLNLGGQINAGLEIIKVLSRHYDMYLPVWVDQKESVSIIPDMQNQVITLKTVEGIKELKIS
jgi:hypothetical protein